MKKIFYKVCFILFLTLIGFIISNCISDNKQEADTIEGDGYTIIRFSSFPKVVNKNVKLLSDSISYGAPTAIEIVDSTLVFRDAMGPPFIHAYRLGDAELVSFGEEGQGPGEYTGAWEIDDVSGTRRFRIYDLSQRRISSCSLDSLFSHDTYKCRAEVTVNGRGGTPLRIDMSRDSMIVATGVYSARLAFHSPKNGKLVKKTGLIPKPVNISTNISSSRRNIAYEAHVSVNLRTSNIYTAAVYADRLDMYGLDGRLTKSIQGPSNFIPKLRVIPTGNLSPVRDTKTAYLDLSIGRNNIYTLYSGLTEREADNDNKSGHKSIFIFDGQGNPLKRINVKGSRLLSIVPSPSGDKIYCTTIYPKPAIGYIDIR